MVKGTFLLLEGECARCRFAREAKVLIYRKKISKMSFLSSIAKPKKNEISITKMAFNDGKTIFYRWIEIQ